MIIIILVTLVVGIGSVWIANLLVVRVGVGDSQGRHAQQGLLGLAAGALLSTSFTHLLPEALESNADVHELFIAMLSGLVFFFLLSKAELWRHSHEHSHSSHNHRGANWTLLIGNGVHCFGDGILIASIFVADVRLGATAAVSVLMHEVPHHIGDLVILRQSNRRSAALRKLFMAGSMTALGGVSGFMLSGSLQHWQPFLMAVAGSSFIFVALSDLIPQLQQRLSTRETTMQVIWLLVGILLVVLVNGVPHERAS